MFEAIDAVSQRANYLREYYPEKFPKPVSISPRKEAFGNLDKIPPPILAIEALWDGDTVHDWFNVIVAITSGPSEKHQKYTSHYLATIYASSPKVDDLKLSAELYCQTLVNDLSNQTGATAFHAIWPPDDEAQRWWDQIYR